MKKLAAALLANPAVCFYTAKMQRTIQDFQELLSEFNRAHNEFIELLDAFRSSVEPGMLERFLGVVRSDQSSKAERKH